MLTPAFRAVARHSLTAPALGLALLAPAAAAQTPAPAAKAPAGATKVTVEGCLTRDTRSPAATSASELYVLVLAAPDATSGGGATGGAVPAPAVPKMYALRSSPTGPTPFAAHVNQRVKVEGTSTDAATTAPLAGRSPEATPYPAPVATGSAGSSATGTPFDRANLPTIVVSTLTSVSPSCK